jgi:MTH538 TIR-like domain (DUF1863)
VAEASSPRVAYRGFISYSHRDAGVGAKLHRRLETYKLPRQLIGSETPRGIVPERLTPIFRDREELSAGENLSQQVQDALAVSECLILLCSPHAKASPWVTKEIESFRALHPDRPILAALLEGEPAEAFPAALTQGGVEPIAADLRKGKDGWRLGQQKLIAGITGVQLDALVQRDAQRQLRRVTAITVGALLALLIMALLLVAALRARAEADRQRTEAEGLVEYMLTDLRDKLKGVGRLDVMTAVNERAMGYYGEQGDLASLPPESLNRRARILHAMGEDDEKRGDLALALKKFEEAHRTTAAVLAQRPNDPDAIFAHAQSEYWVGYGSFLNNDMKSAVSGAEGYRRFAGQLKRIEPDNPLFDMEVGWAENLFGVISLYGLKDLAAAEKQLLVFQRIFQKVVRKLPNNYDASSALAVSHSLLAETYQLQGRATDSLAERTKESAILAELFANDSSHSDLWRLSLIRSRNIASSQVERGRIREADWYLKQAENWSEQLIQLDPQNVEWTLQSARNLLVRAKIQTAQGRQAATNATIGRLRDLGNDRAFLRKLGKQDRVDFEADIQKVIQPDKRREKWQLM